MPDQYHHGNLRAALLERAEQVIARDGVDAVSMRALAADVGVSHAAPRHHFGSRDGLLTALAAQGYRRLAAALRAAREGPGGFAEVGVEYVRFATEHPAQFAVMFDAEALLPDDPELTAARAAAMAEIRSGVETLADEQSRRDMAAATLAGWSMMHGLVELDRSGALEAAHVRELVDAGDLPSLGRRIALLLYGSPSGTPPPPPPGRPHP